VWWGVVLVCGVCVCLFVVVWWCGGGERGEGGGEGGGGGGGGGGGHKVVVVESFPLLYLFFPPCNTCHQAVPPLSVGMQGSVGKGVGKILPSVSVPALPPHTSSPVKPTLLAAVCSGCSSGVTGGGGGGGGVASPNKETLENKR